MVLIEIDVGGTRRSCTLMFRSPGLRLQLDNKTICLAYVFFIDVITRQRGIFTTLVGPGSSELL